ncbi:hypothetical protein L208DRAFT_1489088 [Tricholoma matsutake]|nr:hypothetical protein L208DRAFT_1489088 [Tricholoma matsutake 945]
MYSIYVVPPLGRMPPKSAKPKDPASLPSAPTCQSSRPNKGKCKSDAAHEPAKSPSSPITGDSSHDRNLEPDKTSINPKKKCKQKATGGSVTSLFCNPFLLPGSLNICAGKEKVPAWEPSLMVAESLAASGTGIDQQNTASNELTLTSMALTSNHQPENTLAIDPSLTSAEDGGHIKLVQLLKDRPEGQLYATPQLHGADIPSRSPTIFNVESPKATVVVAQDNLFIPLESPLTSLERSPFATTQNALPAHMSSPLKMFTSPSNKFSVNDVDVSRRPSPFHKDSLSASQKPHRPTRISLSPVAPFMLQPCPQGFSSQPWNLTPHSDFGLPSLPVRNHHGSNHIPPTAAHVRAENQYLGSLLKLFGLIPKQIMDKLVKLETTSEDVVTCLKRVEKQASLITHLTTQSEALEEMVRQLTKQNMILEIAVQDQDEMINKLFAYLKKNNSHGLEDTSISPLHQNAVRKTMLLAMGLGLRAKAKDVIQLHSHPRGGGFIKDQETGSGKHNTVLYPNTDVEEGDEIPVSSTLKPWIMRHPLYQVTEGSLMDSRKQHEREHRGKTGPHPHRRGHPVDAPLPKLKKTNEKIQRYAINKFWLKNHPECDKPTRIEDSEDNNESGGESQYAPEQSNNEGDQFDDNELFL